MALANITNNVLTDSGVATSSLATQSYVTTAVANLVNAAPSTLDTLNELATALGNDANFATTVTTSIGTKLPLAGGTLTGALVGTSATFSGNVIIGGSTPVYLKFNVQETSANRVAILYRGTQGADASMVTAFGTPYLSIGAQENLVNSIQTIGFGFTNGTSYIQPAEIGFQTTSLSGYTLGDLVFATRGVTTNTAPTERLRIASTGAATFSSTVTAGGIIRANASASGQLVIQAVASDGNASIYLRPNNSGYNLISSNYLTTSPYLPLSLSGRENNTDLVLTTSGNVEIGNSAVANLYKLDVNGTGRFTGNVSIYTAGYPALNLGVSSSNQFTWIYDNPNANLLLQKNGSTKITISETGAATFSSSVSAATYLGVSRDGSDTIGAGPYLVLSQTTNSRQWIQQMSAALSLNFYHYNGSAWIQPLTLSATGNVGLGATTPNYALHVYKSSGSSAINVESITGQNSQYRMEEAGVIKFAITYVPSDSSTRFYFAGHGTDLITLKSSTVLIATTISSGYGVLNTYKAPVTSNFVDQIVVQGAGNYPSLRLGTYDQYDGVIATTGNDLRILSGLNVTTENHNIMFYTSFVGSTIGAQSYERLRIAYNGNVGVGTNGTPEGLLDVYKSNSGGLGGHIMLRNNGAAVGNEMAVMFVDGGSGSVRAAISSTTEGAPYLGDIKFKTGISAYGSLSTKMIITGAGNVGIGTLTPEVSFVVKGVSIGNGGKASFYGGGDENNWSAANNEAIRIGRADIANAYYSSIWSASGSSSTESLHWLKFYISNGSNAQTLACTMFGSGNVSVAGALSKGSGSFRIEHPLESLSSTHELVHSFIEGPKADLIYRGKLTLIDGKAEANIDEVSTMTEGTFEVLCRDVQCFTTNETGWDLVKGKVVGNIIYIESQNQDSIDEISWMVIGERKDKHIMDTDWTDDNGKVIVEPLKQINTSENN